VRLEPCIYRIAMRARQGIGLSATSFLEASMKPIFA
jgi:hypothetical protein